MSIVDRMATGSVLTAMDWPHIYIAAAAFLVCALITFTVLVYSLKPKIDFNKGIFNYLKFIYATFLKPHEGDGDGQQGALESFYKAQVRN